MVEFQFQELDGGVSVPRAGGREDQEALRRKVKPVADDLRREQMRFSSERVAHTLRSFSLFKSAPIRILLPTFRAGLSL